MSHILKTQLSRRAFALRGIAILGGALLLAACSFFRPPVPAAHWALLSDTHIPTDPAPQPAPRNHFYFDPAGHLSRVVAGVLAAAPEGIVITGDMARLAGEPGDYARLREFLAPLTGRAPVLMAMGNHDRRENFAKAFPKAPGEPQDVPGKMVRVHDGGWFRFILLDSQDAADKTDGGLGATQTAWLESYLRRTPAKPTFLFVHHLMTDLPSLLPAIRERQEVKAVFYGHSHEYNYAEDAGIHLVNLPATAYSFDEKQPLGWMEAFLTPTEGVLTLHAVDGNRDKDGETRRLRWR